MSGLMIPCQIILNFLQTLKMFFTMEYEELLEQYGMQYLQEKNSDASLYEMGSFEYMHEQKDAIDAFESGVDAYSYVTGDPNNKSNRWMWNDDYFFYDAYGIICSIAESQLLDYYSYNINRNDFMDWCEEMGYIE